MKQAKEFLPEKDFEEAYENNVVLPLRAVEKLPLPYSGNKKKLLLNIYNAISKHNLEFDSVLDVFSGSASVSLLFKVMGKKVITNDLLTSSYMTAVAYVDNDNIKLTPEEKEQLLSEHHDLSNGFVEKNYHGGRFDKFTLKESKRLDIFRGNVHKMFNGTGLVFDLPFIPTKNIVDSFLNDPMNSILRTSPGYKKRIKQALFFTNMQQHILRDCMVGGRMHEGQALAELNSRLSHQKNQLKKEWDNKGTAEMQFLTNSGLPGQGMKWRSFADVAMSGHGLAINCDSISLLNSRLCKVDCAYFDPPYGGSTSDYSTIYRFLEEYIYSESLEELPHIINSNNRFVKVKDYEEQFNSMLEAASYIPLWLFSYNDNSWKSIEYISDLIKKHKRKVTVEVLDDKYRYLYRKKQGRKNKNTEYLIIAEK